MTGMCLLLFGAGGAKAVPSMSAGTTSGAPGTTDAVPVSVSIDTNVVSLQFDLLYAANYLTPGTPVGGDALSDQQVFSAVGSPGLLRVLLVSFTSTALTSGVAAYVPFAIVSNVPDHDETLLLSNVVLVSAQAMAVPVTVTSNATLSITVPPHFNAIFPTNGAIHLDLTGTTGRVYAIQATTNLAPSQWMSLTTNTDVNGVLPFDDTYTGGLPHRFYRALFVR